MYRERRSQVLDAVVWHRTSTGEDVRVLPDGCMDLIWADDGELFVAGPDTRSQLYRGSPGRTLTGIRFAPGIAPAVLGVPAHPLRDLRVPVTDLWPADRAAPIVEAVAAATDPGVILERIASERLRAAEADLARLGAIVRLLAAGSRVTDVAGVVGLSERQLHRRSLDAFGYGPKVLARILRLTRAVERARRGTPFVDAAEGYADQAHFAREVRRLAGVPLSQLTR